VDLSRLRLALLVGAVMTAPVLLVVNAARGGTMLGDAIAIAAGCTLIFLLVVARMQVMLTTVRSLANVLTTQAVELQELVQQDQLTGLANRRAWDAALPAGLDRARGDGTPTTVAIIDLDNFKRYNDTHGHQAGDRLLKEAAAAWTAQRRTIDVLARYGGEEFAILLPNCDAAAAEVVLRRMRAAHPAGESFSAGIAMWDGGESSEHLVARADRALYSAKKAGRDRFAQATSNAKPSAFLAHSWARE
jgi:diguanylate cyclase (GGDEF)-like protein